MEKVCSVNLLQDIVNVPNVDAWLKQAAIEQRVGVSKLYQVCLLEGVII